MHERRHADATGTDSASSRDAAGRRSTPLHGSILYLEGITVSFDGFRALNDLSLYIDARRAALHHRPERRRQDAR